MAVQNRTEQNREIEVFHKERETLNNALGINTVIKLWKAFCTGMRGQRQVWEAKGINKNYMAFDESINTIENLRNQRKDFSFEI